jgi:DNA-binding MarR family transcriptional regulator/ribosomal protein S18 acetylase RimI-like enzyme
MPEPDAAIAAIRRFNRFYTRRLGLLTDRLDGSPFSLAEARVLYELSQRKQVNPGALAADLGLDPGYLSRILSAFRRKGFLTRTRSREDKRRADIAITSIGQAAFAPLDKATAAALGALIAPLGEAGRGKLVAAMAEIERMLDREKPRERTILIRPHRPGDIGWVIARHGALYAREYGWDISFEAFVAEIAAGFVKSHDPARERCWIAEIDGENVGSVFLVRETDEVAKLRLLIVEPEARGLGLGRRLTEECIRFAGEAGYRKLTLWTNDVLTAARAIYEKTGFRLAKSEPHRSFGKELVGEYWERDTMPLSRSGEGKG